MVQPWGRNRAHVRVMISMTRDAVVDGLQASNRGVIDIALLLDLSTSRPWVMHKFKRRREGGRGNEVRLSSSLQCLARVGSTGANENSNSSNLSRSGSNAAPPNVRRNGSLSTRRKRPAPRINKQEAQLGIISQYKSKWHSSHSTDTPTCPRHHHAPVHTRVAQV